MNAPPRRLFFGVWPDEASRQRLAAWQRSVTWQPSARCTAEPDLHLTLHFIGDLPAHALEALSEHADLPEPVPLSFDLDQVLVWPGDLVVLAPSAVPPALPALHEALTAVLSKLGIAVDARRYAPHVTMARSAGAKLPGSGPIEPIRWHSHGYRLAARSGAHYTSVASFESA